MKGTELFSKLEQTPNKSPDVNKSVTVAESGILGAFELLKSLEFSHQEVTFIIQLF